MKEDGVRKELRPLAPWLAFVAGAILAYALSGAPNIGQLQQTIQAQEQAIANQDRVMTQLTVNYCDAEVDVTSYYHLVTERDWRNVNEMWAAQRYAGAQLDLCRWHWTTPNEAPPWK